MPAGPCPYCNTLIDPIPLRSRNCPSCKNPIVVRRGNLYTRDGAIAFDDQVARDRETKQKAKQIEIFKASRKYAAEQLSQAKRSGFITAFRLVVEDDACRFCQARKGLLIPVKGCKAEDLPPYRDCEHESGCDSFFSDVFDDEWPPKRAAKKSSGCLGVILSIIVFSVVFIGVYQAVWRHSIK